MLAAYSMDQFGVIVDDVMILNLISTQRSEAIGLMTQKFAAYFIFLWLIPSVLIWAIDIRYTPFRKKLLSIGGSFLCGIIIVGLCVFSFSKSYASFFRQHKYLRYYTNPTTWIYSSVKFVRKNYLTRDFKFIELGRDAQVVHQSDTPKREITIFVVGETVRSDHISLNGYERETFPLLAKQDVYSFKDVTSCGTSTAISVPCMFSLLGRDNFDLQKARNSDNVLDILGHTGRIKVFWRDNNSDSKGVAVRSDYVDFKTSPPNTLCDRECRDVGMLVGLEEKIKSIPSDDILIVLHQMGNHGPAYFERYPKEFEKFTPACQSRELQKCSIEEIVNAYDNALYYTDHFLNETIELLKKFPEDEVAMFYMSDHGESLGENGVYLHGMPYILAPKEQTHVGAMAWFGGAYEGRLNVELLKANTLKSVSHDNIFHTLLGLFEVKTSVYDKSNDLFDGVIDRRDD